MKMKVVIKVSMHDPKARKKALGVIVSCFGVESAALQGDAKDLVEVIGEGIDAVKITTLLRKKVGCSDIVSVGEEKKEEQKKEEEKKEEEKKEDPPTIIPFNWSDHPYVYNYNGYNPNYIVPYPYVYHLK